MFESRESIHYSKSSYFITLIAKLSQAQAEDKASASAEISFIFDFTLVWAGVHTVWAGVHTVWAGVHTGKVPKVEILARCTYTTRF